MYSLKKFDDILSDELVFRLVSFWFRNCFFFSLMEIAEPAMQNKVFVTTDKSFYFIFLFFIYLFENENRMSVIWYNLAVLITSVTKFSFLFHFQNY